MVNIAEILKTYPKESKLYSTIFGWVTVNQIVSNGDIFISTEHDSVHCFTKYGQYRASNSDLGECLLFPSKEIRTWECTPL